MKLRSWRSLGHNWDGAWHTLIVAGCVAIVLLGVPGSVSAQTDGELRSAIASGSREAVDTVIATRLDASALTVSNASERIRLIFEAVVAADNQQRDAIEAAWVPSLLSDEAALEVLDAAAHRDLADALFRLRVPAQQQAEVELRWFSSGDAWRQLNGTDMARMIDLAGMTDVFDAGVIKAQIEGYFSAEVVPRLQEAFAADPGGVLTLVRVFPAATSAGTERGLFTQLSEDLGTPGLTLARQLDTSPFTDVMWFMYRERMPEDQIRERISAWLSSTDAWLSAAPEQLGKFSWILRDTPDLRPASFDAHVRNMTLNEIARNPRFDGDYTIVRGLAYAFQDATDRGRLIDVVTQGRPDGMPLAVRIAAQAFRDQDSVDGWRTVIDARLGQPDLPADERARWLLASGLTDALRVSGEPVWGMGMAEYRDALETADSSELKFHAAALLARAFAEEGKAAAAADYVREAESAGGLDQASALAELEDDVATSLAAIDHYRRSEAIEARELALEEVIRRLDEALANGRASEILRLEQLKAGLEADLAELTANAEPPPQ